MSFEVMEKFRGRPKIRGKKICFHKQGQQISLSQELAAEIGDSAVLTLDAEARQLGIRRPLPGETLAVRTVRRKSSSPIVCCTRVFHLIGKPSRAHRVDVRWSEKEKAWICDLPDFNLGKNGAGQ